MAKKPAIVVIVLAGIGATGLAVLPEIGGSSPDPVPAIEVIDGRDRDAGREPRRKRTRDRRPDERRPASDAAAGSSVAPTPPAATPAPAPAPAPVDDDDDAVDDGYSDDELSDD